jgi:hypothetical protein
MSIGPAHVHAAADGVLGGFKKIRQTAEAYMDKRDLAGDGWSEEAVTAIAVTEGRPHVDVVEFNRNQEGRGPNALGADYLWWWIDSQTGECFGMLVQAKRLKRGSSAAQKGGSSTSVTVRASSSATCCAQPRTSTCRPCTPSTPAAWSSANRSRAPTTAKPGLTPRPPPTPGPRKSACPAGRWPSPW